MLIMVTMMLMIVTMIPARFTMPVIVSDIISCTFHMIFHYVPPPQIRTRKFSKCTHFGER